jgi:hypothetical protein
MPVGGPFWACYVCVIVVPLFQKQGEFIPSMLIIPLHTVCQWKHPIGTLPKDVNILIGIAVKTGESEMGHDVISAGVVVLALIGNDIGSIEIASRLVVSIGAQFIRLQVHVRVLAPFFNAVKALADVLKALQIGKSPAVASFKGMLALLAEDDFGSFDEDRLQSSNGLVPAAVLEDGGLQCIVCILNDETFGTVGDGKIQLLVGTLEGN